MAQHSQNNQPIYTKWWFYAIIFVTALAIGMMAATALHAMDDKQLAEASAPEEAEQPAATPVESAEPVEQEDPSVPKEYISALEKAKIYSERMHMSKAAIYDQLVSEYGEKFSEEAAQYAIDNLVADWKANALAKAEYYQDNLYMSPSAIYDQLVSDYGEQFTPEEAQYAINHLSK